MNDMAYSRRQFVGKCISTCSLFLGGSALIMSGCNSNPNPSGDKDKSASNPCGDLSGISNSELEKRHKFAYVDASPVPGNSCGNCSLYVPRENSADCGGCLLFQGPVHATGHCIQYAAKT